MANISEPSASEGSASSLRERILESARVFLLARGTSGLTMDELARDLGVSKKTLYVHFPGKEAILGTIIELIAHRMEARLDAVVNDKSLDSAGKLCGLIEVIGANVARLNPGFVRDLRENAPKAFARIDAVRRRNIPRFFGRILREGMAEGCIRQDIDADFVCEFWMHAIRGLLDPETLERTQLTAPETLRRAVDLFLRGLVTPQGREQYQQRVQERLLHADPSKQPLVLLDPIL